MVEESARRHNVPLYITEVIPPRQKGGGLASAWLESGMPHCGHFLGHGKKREQESKMHWKDVDMVMLQNFVKCHQKYNNSSAFSVQYLLCK